jgi:hypothetical protein
MGMNLLNFIVINKYSTILLLILFVILRYLSSKVMFRMTISVMLTSKVVTGNERSIEFVLFE